MGIKKIFARSRDKPSKIPVGRATTVNRYSEYLSPYRSRSADLLKELRAIPTEEDAIEFIVKKTSDASMAVWNFVRLGNQGHEMKFYSINNRSEEIPELASQWREFAARINPINNAGLDGLIDLLHKNAVMYGNQMCEVVVSKDRTEIEDVYVIDPRTVFWEWEERNGEKVSVPYQYSNTKKIDLSKANFFSVPLDPDTDDPRGTLILSPALQSVDYQLQVFNDVHAVLHHQGYSKNDITMKLEELMTICPAHIKNDSEKLLKWINEQVNNTRNNLENVAPDSDYIHTSDTEIKTLDGANNNKSLDVRAINELTDVQINNGLKQLSTFTNRHTGKTETYSSVEMKIFTQGILSLQRGSKRLIESIATLWLRVHGAQAVPVFTHNPIDYVAELQRKEIKLKDIEYYAKAQALGWLSPDEAAKEAVGAKKAYTQVSPEQIRASFKVGGVMEKRYVSRQIEKLHNCGKSQNV